MSDLSSTWHWSFWLPMVVLFHVFIALPSSRLAMAQGANMSNYKFPAFFAFGDSIVDSGNNNYIPFSVIKANFPPNGKDFIGKKATGRFCNGRLATDFMVEKLGIKKLLPASRDTTLLEDDLLTGVSFASAGSGYDPVTAALVLTTPLDVQFEWFEEYLEKVRDIVGFERTNYIVKNSLFFIVSGNCDLANTYFTIPFARITHDVDSYTDIMLDGAMSLVKNLYKKGARTIAVSSVPPLGYLPSQRTLGGGPTRAVNARYNRGVQAFNYKLQAALHDFSFKSYMSNIIYVDTYNIFLDIVNNYTEYGFKLVDRGCCGSGLIEAAVLCNPFSLVCEDNNFLFWDSFHPTEMAYELIADRILSKYFHRYL